jgi:hypothetical protein
VASNDSDCLLLGVSIIKNALTNTPTIVDHNKLEVVSKLAPKTSFCWGISSPMIIHLV